MLICPGVALRCLPSAHSAAQDADSESKNVRYYDLNPESELRIEVHVTREVTGRQRDDQCHHIYIHTYT